MAAQTCSGVSLKHADNAVELATCVYTAAVHRAAGPRKNGEGLKMLEIAAGTGRFATFVRDNFPAANLTVSELSPYYLQEARESMAHWQAVRGGATGSTSFVQCAAEELPVADESMDIVYCMYMFHEVPDNARDAAILEMARVLKPGGTLVICDSTQLGDRPGMDKGLQSFEKLNEPYYLSYLRYNFARRFSEVGLQPSLKQISAVSKTLSATKPL